MSSDGCLKKEQMVVSAIASTPHLLILFYLITDLRVNKSLPFLAYKNEIGCLLRNCFKDLPGFRYYPGE
ncbi:hypothetical protein OSL38_20155 [Escherichia coli]|nr:hypothetical protein [Escherichia coli]MDA6418597.1 hypothetical protein [Escherichia coli]MDA6597583.1 hypothetical protein [Escherichia coli]MDA6879891.1 hypothetical protein [Escherichia coli]MDA6914843.1 hypothetical protein [Escherichia coli]